VILESDANTAFGNLIAASTTNPGWILQGGVVWDGSPRYSAGHFEDLRAKARRAENAE